MTALFWMEVMGIILKCNCLYPVCFPLQPHFCGPKPVCFDQSDDYGLSLAISKIKRNYLVVGTLERMEDTLRLIEEKIPPLKGILDVYKERTSLPGTYVHFLGYWQAFRWTKDLASNQLTGFNKALRFGSVCFSSVSCFVYGSRAAVPALELKVSKCFISLVFFLSLYQVSPTKEKSTSV